MNGLHGDHPTAARWRKSSHSNGQGGCVEVDDSRPGTVRDSKDPEGPTLSFRADAWRAFVAAVNSGEFGDL
ncbi:DUF397 domain-containing protein [Kitasatospora sp. NPDC051170]|uniref:DUF397 domain-containing protein n=1 Tax=Kitasatospora sp. NPDC051170 TaxID=3364056 RepID=UPI00378C3C6F